MRKTVSAAAMMALLLTLCSFGYAQQGSPSGQSGWYGCPMMGQGRVTGPGGWYCPWMGGYYGHRCGSGTQSSYNQGGQPLTKDQAEQLVKNDIQGNPNLKVGEFADKGDFYEATIVTKKEGALVERIQVDKKTGWFRNVP
jgi:hypothetical protein